MKIYEAEITYEATAERIRGDKRPRTNVEYTRSLFEESPYQEQMVVILIDAGTEKPVGRIPETKGTLTSSLVHPREVFKPVILAGVGKLIVVHNHPTGDPHPSSADIQVTSHLREAAEVLGLELIDHIIAGDIESDPAGKGYYSFVESGLL